MSLQTPDVSWLREARERKGVTLDHLANTTKIRPAYLTALEAGAKDKLPPPFFTRGFLKAYAKEVGLDPDQTVDRYLAQLAPGGLADEDVAAIVETAVSRYWRHWVRESPRPASQRAQSGSLRQADVGRGRDWRRGVPRTL